MRARLLAALALALLGCGPDAPEPISVPPHCYAEDTSLTIDLAEGDVVELHYGLQGGQHLELAPTLRGFDPHGATVHFDLFDDVRGELIASQGFTTLSAGVDPCDVVVRAAPLFVATSRVDGLHASLRLVAHPGRPDARAINVRDFCVSSTGACDPLPLLTIMARGAPITPGGRALRDDDGVLRFTVPVEAHGEGELWGRLGDLEIESSAGTSVALTASEGETFAVRLVLTDPVGFGQAPVHLARFDGSFTVGCDPLSPSATCGEGRSCERALDDADAPSRCRDAGDVAPGGECASAEECVAGATCASERCRAWCDPASPSCGEGEHCAAHLDTLGVCEPD